VARHKPFWHIRKLNKAQDEPLTEENKEFIHDFVDKKYSGPLKQVPARSVVDPDPRISASYK
jgi:hypothetical protein